MKKKNRKKIIMRAAGLLCGFALVFALCVYNRVDLFNKKDEFCLEDYHIIWGNSSEAEPDVVCEFGGKSVTYSLYKAIEKSNGGELLAITPEIFADNDYIYNGKSLKQYREDIYNSNRYYGKMEELLKCGDYLKYGERLYNEGAPDGERWAKQHYEEVLIYYGEEMLSKYIVDGEFLSEQLKADIAAYNIDEAQNAYEEAFDVYKDKMINSIIKDIEKSNLHYVYNPKDKCLIMFISKQQFEGFMFDGAEHCRFTLSGPKGKMIAENA